MGAMTLLSSPTTDRCGERRSQKGGSHEKTAWRVGPGDWERFKHYDEFVGVCEDALRETSTGEAPWQVIDGSDRQYR
jgi:polyphosphate kinase 2 (PPK2 family)